MELDTTCKDQIKMLMNGQSILSSAMNNCNIEMTKYLIENGAEITITQSQIDNYQKW